MSTTRHSWWSTITLLVEHDEHTTVCLEVMVMKSLAARWRSCSFDANINIRFCSVGPLSWMRNLFGSASPVILKWFDRSMSCSVAGSVGWTPPLLPTKAIPHCLFVTDGSSGSSRCRQQSSSSKWSYQIWKQQFPDLVTSQNASLAAVISTMSLDKFNAWACGGITYYCY